MGNCKFPLLGRATSIPTRTRQTHPPLELQTKVRTHTRSFSDLFTDQTMTLMREWMTTETKDERALSLKSASHRMRREKNVAASELRLGWNSYSPVAQEVIKSGCTLVQDDDGSMKIETSTTMPPKPGDSTRTRSDPMRRPSTGRIRIY